MKIQLTTTYRQNSTTVYYTEFKSIKDFKENSPLSYLSKEWKAWRCKYNNRIIYEAQEDYGNSSIYYQINIY